MELLGKSLEELKAYCKAVGEPAYRGGQIYRALSSHANTFRASGRRGWLKSAIRNSFTIETI